MKENLSSTVRMYTLGAFIRLWLATSDYQKVIAEHIEISTPLNSWKQVTESLHLLSLNIDSDIDDIFHESPLHLLAYKHLVAVSGKYLYLIFVVCDILTAFLLHLMTTKFTSHMKDAHHANYAAAAYLFNPYLVFNCAGLTTTVFGNLFMALFLTGMVYKSIPLSALPLALSITQNFYPIILVSPLLLQLKIKAIPVLTAVITFIFALTYCSYKISGSWDFLGSTYGFILNAPDLRPNIGIFWYFFTEMFEHFHTLFIYVFQINISLLYLIPLSIRFRKNPMFLTATFLSLIAIFKSYPCVGDVGFVLSLLPCWSYLFNYMQQYFTISLGLLITTTLAPTFWHLWIYAGSANANFYFGVSLAFVTVQLFLIADILFAYMKHEFAVAHERNKVEEINTQLMLE